MRSSLTMCCRSRSMKFRTISLTMVAAEPPKEMKLYVFTSGGLTLDKSIIQNGASGKITHSGRIFPDPSSEGQCAVRLRQQRQGHHRPGLLGTVRQGARSGAHAGYRHRRPAQKINVKPSDVNYVVLGHFHLDHAGNVGKFPDATFVYQRDEIKNAFWPEPGFATFYITGDFALLRNSVGGGMPTRSRPSSSRATSICLATTASRSTAPCRIPRQPDGGRAPAQDTARWC